MRKDNNSHADRRRRGRPVEEGAVHAASWRARAEDVVARMNSIREAWTLDSTCRAAWAAIVDLAGELTAAWPEAMARRVAGVTSPAEVSLLPWTLERPVKDALAGVVDLVKILACKITDPPEPLELAPAPATAAAAREQWLCVRMDYTRVRIAVRRGHRRRDDLRWRIDDAASRAVAAAASVWLARADSAAGDYERALALAQSVRRELLNALARALDDRTPRNHEQEDQAR
jgi:hypothetical protein